MSGLCLCILAFNVIVLRLPMRVDPVPSVALEHMTTFGQILALVVAIRNLST